jgi:Tfp pilus assembly protein PilX
MRGAALPIALILLTVITLLMVAAMRSTSLGFVMASNEQLRQRAFVAAETGIEQAIATGTFNPDIVTPQPQPSATAAGDTYQATITTQLNGAPQGAVFGNSWNSFSTYQFQIVSTGTSARSATVVNTQGVAVIAPYSSLVTGPGGL